MRSRRWVSRVCPRSSVNVPLISSMLTRAPPSVDSKTLTDPLREELFKDILQHKDDVKYAVTVMSPADISMGMLRKQPYNLCAVAPLFPRC